jgi:hypothetical protein
MAATRRTYSWGLWRGSVDLVLHVVKTAADSVSTVTGNDDVPVWLIVGMEYDQELFRSIDDFRTSVTPEALRKFKWIDVRVGVPSIWVQVLWSRQKPGAALWARFFWFLQKPGTYRPAVQLTVAAEDPKVGAESVESIALTVGVALQRGFHSWDVRWRSPLGLSLVACVLWVAVLFAALQFSFVREIQSDAAEIAFLTVSLLLPFALLVFVHEWVLPVVEVAPKGQTRVARVRTAVITLALGLIGTGISRRLFG